MAFLELNALTKRYGPTTAVDRISFNVERGSFVSLLGPSGCGKTTTLQMIAGFEEVSSGHITLNGRDLAAIPARHRGLGIVFQTYALFMHMTAAENVSFGLEMRKVAKDERKRRVDRALDLVHLSHLADRYPRAMSGGQRQRVALARALVIEPELLLLDEPLSNLDAKLREEMQIELRRIQREAGVTTLMVTHDQAEALALSDRVVVMEKGRIEQEAAPFEIYDTPRTAFVSSFIGKSNLLSATLVSTSDAGSVLDCRGTRLDGLPVKLRPGPALISLRPERIQFSAENPLFTGTVRERVFLGNQWLLTIETPIGDLLVVRRNMGMNEAGIGDTVGLSFTPKDMRVLPVQEAEA
ncbi:ABC transporter ATP-binding protein [Martelella alba]|uniref:ABC transporter ATP-binding protein n=1 Tax=Martelella alba TaxID=2590451 RepID=A0A506UCM4_9HYPH|nr:ABC transporter ATP-binding protein [Martelella alba]